MKINKYHQWQPNTWRNNVNKYKNIYINNHDEQNELDVVNYLKTLPNIVNVKNIHQLSSYINSTFVLHIGECAELFSQANKEDVQARLYFYSHLRALLEQNYKTVTLVGRIAGQYAKPRTEIVQQYNGKTLNNYLGDIVNSFDIDKRTPNINNLTLAYQAASNTYKYIEEFYHTVKNNDLFYKNAQENQYLDNILKVKLHTLEYKPEYIYTSHEALILQYEEALTRKIDDRYYNLSAHLLWVGAQNNALYGAQIEYIRGIYNPVMVKIHPKNCNIDYIQNLMHLLQNRVKNGIPVVPVVRISIEDIHMWEEVLKYYYNSNNDLIWCVDPMHANTTTYNDIKVRYYEDILNNYKALYNLGSKYKLPPRGISLEATYNNVTECIDDIYVYKHLVSSQYHTKCDPRLNVRQSFHIIQDIINLK